MHSVKSLTKVKLNNILCFTLMHQANPLMEGDCQVA